MRQFKGLRGDRIAALARDIVEIVKPVLGTPPYDPENVMTVVSALAVATAPVLTRAGRDTYEFFLIALTDSIEELLNANPTNRPRPH
jgi:hypothetical protein